ncbi:MAG: imidazole glycerol phosphate synthase subunit HisH [Thermodesulfobacteriota bacterium]
MTGRRIAVIDYDMGNLMSVTKALEWVGAEAAPTRDPAVIRDATHIVLPGVGAFRDCMRHLTEYGLVEPLLGGIEAGKPFLGICLGLQLLFDESTEFGSHRGLGLVGGRIERFPSGAEVDGEKLKIPHMGWNGIKIKKDSKLLAGIPDGTYFYFVHSYYAAPKDPSVVLTTTDYGIDFASSIEVGNIHATQFHPEKSQKAGLRVLKNFSNLE